MTDNICPDCGHPLHPVTAPHASSRNPTMTADYAIYVRARACERLRAENAALTEARNEMRDKHEALAHHFATLRAENAHHKDTIEGMSANALKMEGEIARLTNCLAKADTAHLKCLDELASVRKDDAKDAALWRWFRNHAWVGTTEDNEVCLSAIFGEPSEVGCFTEAERELFENDSPDPKDFSALCQRIAEWRATPTPEEQ